MPNPPVIGQSTVANIAGVFGENTAAVPSGISFFFYPGVRGESRNGHGVEGVGFIGVHGQCQTTGSTGILGFGGYGVWGECKGDGTGVVGVNQTTGSSGFLGGKERHFNGHVGVYGESPQNEVWIYGQQSPGG